MWRSELEVSEAQFFVAFDVVAVANNFAYLRMVAEDIFYVPEDEQPHVLTVESWEISVSLDVFIGDAGKSEEAELGILLENGFGLESPRVCRQDSRPGGPSRERLWFVLCNAESEGAVDDVSPLMVVGGIAFNSTRPLKQIVWYSVPTFADAHAESLLSNREVGLRHVVEGDSMQGPVVRAKESATESTLQRWKDHLASRRVNDRGWWPFWVAGGLPEPVRSMHIAIYERLEIDRFQLYKSIVGSWDKRSTKVWDHCLWIESRVIDGLKRVWFHAGTR